MLALDAMSKSFLMVVQLFQHQGVVCRELGGVVDPHGNQKTCTRRDCRRMHRTGYMCVSGDVSPTHSFLGTDGVCVRGAGAHNRRETANDSLCRVLGAMWWGHIH